jgi:hypothetical protein
VEAGVLNDPPIRGLADVIPEVTPIDRVSTNAWEDIREAVEATGRRTLLIAGIWTEVCLAQTAVSALAEGYRVFFVSDCSGGMSMEAHEDAKTRLVQAGATPINWMAIICEWTPDFTTDERHRVNPPVMKHGSMAGLAVEYIWSRRLMWLLKLASERTSRNLRPRPMRATAVPRCRRPSWPRTAGRLQDSSAGAGSVPRSMMLS